MVGEGIAKFVPQDFNLKQMPSFALKAEPQEKVCYLQTGAFTL